jgi:hypothetical protein
MSSGMIFVLAIVAMMTVSRIVRTVITAKAKDGGRELGRQNEALARQNATLVGKVERLEDRIAVLERIATDAPARLTAEIEKLRD